MKLFSYIVFIAICFSHGVQLSAQDVFKTDSLELAFQLSHFDEQKVDLLLALAEEYLTNDPLQARLHSTRALALSDSIAYIPGQATALRILAELDWSSSDYKGALQYATQASVLAKEIDNRVESALINRIFGLVFADLGSYEKSSQYFFESLKIFEALDDKIGISKSLNSIGYVLFEQENYDKALEYYFQSLAISREIHDPNGIARGLNNLAAVYGNRKEYEKVRRFLFEAVRLNQQTGQRFWEGINYQNLGVIHREEKNYDSAYFYYNQAIRIFTELNHIPKLARTIIGLSRYYKDIEDLDQSLIYAQHAFELGKEHALLKVMEEAAENLHEVYKALGESENAYTFGLMHYQLKDSLELEKSMTRHSQLELVYEYEKLSQENRIEEQRKEFTYIIIIISLVFILIVSFVLFTYRQKIKAKNTLLIKKQLESELELRNKELTSNVMMLMKKNEVLSDIANKLMMVQEEAVKDETKTAIRKLAKALQKTSDDEVWEEFEARFMQVHGEFYRKLISRFPDLSPNEQKLSAFLRLNMSTKEISELTGQRTGSLEIARARLRKKLGIAHTNTNLVNFLSQI